MTTLNTPTTQTQCANILAALSAGRGVTPVDALIEFSCFRLATRIYDLRKAGHQIVTHLERTAISGGRFTIC